MCYFLFFVFILEQVLAGQPATSTTHLFFFAIFANGGPTRQPTVGRTNTSRPISLGGPICPAPFKADYRRDGLARFDIPNFSGLGFVTGFEGQIDSHQGCRITHRRNWLRIINLDIGSFTRGWQSDSPL